ncbi:MAG TPA: hypothetical protein VJA21_19520 [Verrucomicrobiae bacterium]
MGDTRLIREDAKLLFRKSNKEDEDEDDEDWKDEKSDDSETDLEQVDYEQVLKHIDNFLPVKELAGRPVDLEILRQFGLVDNEKVDHFLASAFAKAPVNSESDKPGPQTEPQKPVSKVPRTNQSEQNN